jgi:hypothetical protein
MKKVNSSWRWWRGWRAGIGVPMAVDRTRLRIPHLGFLWRRTILPLGIVAFLVLSAVVLPPAASKEEQKDTEGGSNPGVDPNVVKALDQMGAYLRTLTAFDVESTNSTDEVLENGQKVQFDGTVQLQVRRPNKLHAEVKTDRKHREFFYDGQTFTVFGRRVNYYASVPAPPTLRELLAILAQRYGIEVPLADLILWGTQGDRTSRLTSAIDLGPSTIRGAECEQYALREEGVDWQVWIQKGETPLPRKLVITTTSIPSQPQYVTVMNWNLTPKLDEATFSFSPPEGAMRIVLQTADGKVARQSERRGK